jgi:hypothetical protein
MALNAKLCALFICLGVANPIQAQNLSTSPDANAAQDPTIHITGDVFRDTGIEADATTFEKTDFSLNEERIDPQLSPGYGELPYPPIEETRPAAYDAPGRTGEELTEVWSLEEEQRAERTSMTPRERGEASLADWIRKSRDDATKAGTRILTNKLTEDLALYFDRDLLKSIRYRYDPGFEFSTLANAVRIGDQAVVVLGDTIVFKNRFDAEHNLTLWAHAVAHVAQFQSWGIDEYASRYLRGYPTLESEAWLEQEAYLSAVNNAGKGDILIDSQRPDVPEWVNQCTLYDLDLRITAGGRVFPHGNAARPPAGNECLFDLTGEYSRYCVINDGSVLLRKEEPLEQGAPAGSEAKVNWYKVGTCSAYTKGTTPY